MNRFPSLCPRWSTLVASLFLTLVISLPALAQEFPSTVDLNRKLQMLPAGASVDAVTLDSAGNVYMAGTTASALTGASNAIGSLGNGDIFVIKLNAATDQVLYTTVLGGSANESVRAIRADASGNLYLAGTTNSFNFPATTQLVPTNPVGGFVAKLNAAGTALTYATQLGSRIIPLALDVDSAGAAYVSGQAHAADLPTTPGVLRPSPLAASGSSLYVGFLAKVNAAGTQLDLATYYGADNQSVDAVSVRPNGSIMILTSSTLAVLNAGLSQQVSTVDTGVSQATLGFDGSGNLYVSGTLTASNVYGIRKYATDGVTRLLDLPLTFFGSPLYASAVPLRVAVTSAGRMYVFGRPNATNFPTKNATQTCLANIAPPNGSAGVPVADQTLGTVGDPPVPDYALTVLGADGKSIHSTYLSTNLTATPVISASNGKIYAAGSQTLFTTPRSSWYGLVRFDPAIVPTDRVSPACLVHSATFEIVPASPGALMTIFGSSLGPATGVSFGLDSTGKVPSTLAGASVTVDSRPATMLYAADTQINFIIPWATRTDGALVPVCVSFGGNSKCFQVSTTPVTPGVFQGVRDATTGALLSHAILNSDNSVNTPEGKGGKPAKRGTTVVIFMTGGGLVDGTLVDGGVTSALQYTRATVTAIQSSTGNTCGFLGCKTAAACTVLNVADCGGGYNVKVAFAGAAPSLVQGVTQINLDIPADMSAGPSQLFILYFLPPGATKPIPASVLISVKE